ncbi:hypothetical protein FZEAL_6178 [Fusarium zealandicum]|uniref:SGT1 n=1 Tax=Fusarium zealandicum TaxID=1053134 RepID=A0A8H4UID1_9HYPO|nr:hypothetical protein FZEAL_6178 [Fusarium zealandicum]
MSHITQAQQGLAAADARNWDEAITKLSAALKVSPNPTWLIARSKALISQKRFQEALDDANLAWYTAYDRNKRPLLVEAHYRRAVAYFRLGQYANADACCVYAMRLIKGFPAVEKEDPAKARTDEKGLYTVTLEEAQREAATDEINKTKGEALTVGDKGPAQAKEWRTASTLRMQILFAMNKLEEEDLGRKLTTGLKPEQKELADLAPEKKPEASKPIAVAPSKPVVPADTPMRFQDFQNDTTMTVSIFSKGVNKEKLQVKYSPFSVHLDSVIYPNGDEKPFTLDLWGEIDTAASKHTVTPNKVELSLKKKTAGKWQQLKGEAKESTSTAEDTAAAEEAEKLKILKEARQKAMDAAEKTAEPTPAEDKPAPSAEDEGKAPETSKPATSYPSSSRTGPKDWDKVGADEDSEDEKDVNRFFKKLFKGANPEQQRAMMKSFTESNGTSLSTDWNDVKDRTVETVPPEGVEAKKWDSK